MNHQPFEDWIFDPGVMTAEERRALQNHLQECAQCQRLERRWLAVHQQMRARPMVAPAPGFTQRWQSGLAQRRAQEQRKQAWKIFGMLLGGAVFILLLLSGYLIATTTPAEWLTALVRTVSGSQEILDLLSFTFQSWLSASPLALNIALWIYLTLTLCLLSSLWGLIIWRTNSAGAH